MCIEKSYNGDFEGTRKQERVYYFGKLTRHLGRVNYRD
jgi:hypothetical protein